ncbi:zinc-finger double domain-containing protein [Ditylenchus destructor]|uniref:Zinc-finger double domain-containing protein n=1 Tax=Ditylenchus destructor TaxID=166010 RepID=A0AAD4MUL2_9BILA|nr:zinc-finger double domain-containing protein [Ditylenchus destructor]
MSARLFPTPSLHLFLSLAALQLMIDSARIEGIRTNAIAETAHDSRKANHRGSNERKVQSNSKPKVRPQLNKKRQMAIGLKRAIDGEKRYKCEQCHKYATNKEVHLTRHMRRHARKRPYKCQMCNYAATERYHLVRHERTHSGEKPFKCRFCEFASARDCHLSRHMRTKKHKGTLN